MKYILFVAAVVALVFGKIIVASVLFSSAAIIETMIQGRKSSQDKLIEKIIKEKML